MRTSSYLSSIAIGLALLAAACGGGDSEDNLFTGAGGSAGSAGGSAGSAGQGGKAGSGAAGQGGTSAGKGGAAGSSAGQGGSSAGKGGSAGKAGSAGGAGKGGAGSGGSGQAGDAGSGQAGDAGSGQAGNAGSSGKAGSGQAGDAGSGQAGDAGSGQAGDAGSGQAGDAGSGQGGAGSGAGGDAGAGQAGDAGAAGDAGSGQAGDAGSGQAGDAGAGGDTGAGGDAGSGQAGSSAGGAGQGGSSAGSGQAGDAGSGQAGDAGSGQAGDAGSGQAGAAGSGQGGDAGSGQAGDAGSGQAGNAGSGGAAGDAGAGGDAGQSGSGGGGNQCASGIVCGANLCCDAGQECVFGACLAACASQVRCGPQQACCGAGQVCVADQCATPGKVCLDYADCEENEFCEPALGKCLPQVGEPACIFKPPVGTFDPVLEWSWTGSSIQPTHNQVINTPLVMDLEKDGTPDVIIVTSDNYNAGGVGYLRALDGKTGKEKWGAGAGVYQTAGRIQPRSTPAVADIDGDGFVEIVTLKSGGGLIAFEHDGTIKWTSTTAQGAAFAPNFDSSAVTIADLEGDGVPEIIAGGAVLENTGKVRFNKGVLVGSNNNTYGAVSIVADVDGDGKQELLSGNAAYRSDGSTLWTNGLADGYPAIADLDLDGKPELVVICNDRVRVHDATTGVQLAILDMPGNGAGGPPTVAQFDGVGGPDFASANGTAYNVFTYDAATKTISVIWSKPTQDGSSNRTGSTVFDFEGDGKAEVIYNDECYMRIYAGIDGAERFKLENSSATIHEYPVIADVDGDNNTEIIVGANDLNHKNNSVTCPYPAAQSRHGLFVYGDKQDRWVRTRRVWNQHSYHVTNINNDGSVPAPENVSWGPKGFNNYRQSTQGKASYNAADMQVSLSASLQSCPGTLTLNALVKNGGSLGVPVGVSISFYKGDPPNGLYLGTAKTTTALLPGASETVPLLVPDNDVPNNYYVIVDADAGNTGLVNECIESNNTSAISYGATCKIFE